MPNRRSSSTPGRDAGIPEAAGEPMPEALARLSWGLPRTFLGLDEAASAFASARSVILPVPYEATTSWGMGTRCGPRAILDASQYVELYDSELDAEPCMAGIHTLPALELTRDGPAAALAELEEAWGAVFDAAGGSVRDHAGGASIPSLRPPSARPRSVMPGDSPCSSSTPTRICAPATTGRASRTHAP